MRTTPTIALLALMLMMTGCVMMFDDPDESESERSSERLASGYTPCGDEPDQSYGVICHPNQYCSSQSLAICRQGCLSNDNCTDEQRCVKDDGDDVGRCIDRDAIAGDELGAGYTSCGDGLAETICHPNQYCDDPGRGQCELGCLSSDNCTDEQWCDKGDGDHVGICTQ